MTYKTYYLFILLLFVTTICPAQDFYFGLKGAYNLSTLSDQDDSPLLDSRNTFGVSAVFDFKPAQSDFGISFEPGYIRKGAVIDSDTLDYVFHFIGGPILFNYSPIPNFKVSVGPELAYLTEARNIPNDSTKISILDDYDNRWEISGTLGASYSLSFFADVGVRYSLAFTDLASSDALIDSRNLYTQYFQVFLLLKVAN